MDRAVCAALVLGATAAVTAGAVFAGLATWREAVVFWLLPLLWYPFDRFLNYLAGWGPRAPSDQDRT